MNAKFDFGVHYFAYFLRLKIVTKFLPQSKLLVQ